MNLLIIGGTIFLGRHLTEAALGQGHTVTLFNRGRHNPELFPDAEKIQGDRTNPEDLARLAGRAFDAVIDTCGYLPRVVRLSAERLADRVGCYCFISSVSVYSDTSQPGMDEGAPVGTLDDPSVEEITGETYGPLKALCEAEAERALPGRSLIVRPGLIVGPHDPSDRFTYWPCRIAEGGVVLAPDRPDVAVQLIDVRDLAGWIIRTIESGASGIYNATGPDYRLTMGAVLDACIRAAGSDARLEWLPEAFLAEQEVSQWTDLPLWVSDRETPGFHTMDVGRAMARGLTFRSIETTARDTLAWARTLPAEREWKAGLTRERERAVLAAYAEQAQNGPNA